MKFDDHQNLSNSLHILFAFPDSMGHEIIHLIECAASSQEIPGLTLN